MASQEAQQQWQISPDKGAVWSCVCVCVCVLPSLLLLAPERKNTERRSIIILEQWYKPNKPTAMHHY